MAEKPYGAEASLLSVPDHRPYVPFMDTWQRDRGAQFRSGYRAKVTI